MTDRETAHPPRPLRADAARNRAKILDAAAAAFDEQGTDASLEDVARTAGVGVGTLYRHFPTRLDLIAAVYRSSLEQFVARADELLEQKPAGEALDEWVMGFVGYVVRKRGMSSALKAGLGDGAAQVMSEGRALLEGAAARLLVAAQAAGAVRDDLAPADLLRAVSGVCLAGADSADRTQTERVLRLVLDGLRWTAPAPA
ncbi:TetR/AcrR family transcriptional regulator [Cellulomonas sp. DKR-3]|uniref:TetR/AcrR family transcriptional regulator n=1 Tax=Cellulomonas fulva TaxID=2835530 RepID=A0ABS5TXQ0_9CELL|nr:TetR/AcrR family transcriptional regulator [Cellulomonas fulva]MBT0993876.1 TetR/AcrR family transcriptional regulator [Cellulomonas fulva]